MQCFRQNPPCLCAQVHALNGTNRQAYFHELNYILKEGTNGSWDTMSSPMRARVLAALHITGQHQHVNRVLALCEITDIDRALLLLDRPRWKHQLELKIARIEASVVPVDANTQTVNENDVTEDSPKARKRKQPKLNRYRNEYKKLQDTMLTGEETNHRGESCWGCHSDTAVMELIRSSSVSGSLARKVRHHVHRLQPDFLEFVLLHELPTRSWKRVADLVHFKPSNFTVPYFLESTFGKEVPSDTFIYKVRQLVQTTGRDENLAERFHAVATEFPQLYLMYSVFRSRKPVLLSSRGIVGDLAQHMPLETLLWYFEELQAKNRECVDILEHRLLRAQEELCLIHAGGQYNRDDPSGMTKVYTYGKLLERLLTFKRMSMRSLVKALQPIAAAHLEALQAEWSMASCSGGGQGKVAVFGDASSSMQMAVEAGTIFASMLSACLNGKLSFFATGLVVSPYETPRTVEETLEVCSTIRASGCTNLAAALWPYLASGEWLDTIVLVTDEGENGQTEGHHFASMLQKYKQDVNANVKLTIVCVGSGVPWFRKGLTDFGIEFSVVTIDEERPDLTKFDGLLHDIANLSGIRLHSPASPANASTTPAISTSLSRVPPEDEDTEFVLIEPPYSMST
eukprot:Nitzschia sp. Nitz4//scaffold259_size27336//15697//17577//NITZ4_008192-RA/size27336-processed-gene-0.5-mRNA-1//-1//CDS//3329544507//1915//frame0